jgi:hypothetical protein
VETLILHWPSEIGGLLSLGCLLGAFRSFRRRSLSEGLPTSRALGVFIGLVEMKGTAVCEDPLVSYIAGASCVYYAYTIEEEWERTTTDSNGRIKTEKGWTEIDKGEESTNFYVKDSSGAILVRPKGAEVDGQEIIHRIVGRFDPLYAKGGSGSISDSTGRRRIIEKVIRTQAPVYLIGKARERKDMVAAEIAEDETAEMFFISAHNEDEVQSSFFWHGIAWTIVGLVLLVGGFVLEDNLTDVPWRPRVPFYAMLMIPYFAAWSVAWVWNAFNFLIGLRNRVREGWALIDIQLKRRADLIPNLVMIVQALRDHEGVLQPHLALLRAQAGALRGDARALKPALAAVQEKYPVLRAMAPFQNLQKNLIETEERIALARDYYNAIAMHFNTRLEQIPDRWVAALTMTRRFDLVAAQGFERAPIKVDF